MASTELESTNAERVAAEVALLQSMYPDGAVTFSEQRSEITYTSTLSAGDSTHRLVLRLPTGYPSLARPEVLVAKVSDTDDRDTLAKRLSTYNVGDELLDVLIAEFDDLVSEYTATKGDDPEPQGGGDRVDDRPSTIVIWLHHLLATSKRKMALDPPTAAAPASSPSPAYVVSGVTKPGYPGVMIFSGPGSAVREHVATLRNLNWQAFQVRLESEDDLWLFEHGMGMKEVETMGDVVKHVPESKRLEFLKCMGIKD